MKFGVSVQDQKLISEERRIRRKPFPDGSDLTEAPPESIESLNADDGTGTDREVFVLGIHSLWDSTPRWIPA